MMKKTTFILFFLSVILGVQASSRWSLQGEMYVVDTLYHAYVGPGTTQTTLTLKGKLNLKVFYTTTDLSNENVGVKVVMGNNKLSSPVTVPNLPASSGDTQNSYFAGVNADMFSYTGTGTIGNSVANELVYKTYKGNGWYGFGINKDKKMKIGATSVSFKIAGYPSAKGVNATRSDGEIIIYTSQKGASAGTSSGGLEYACEFVDGTGLKSNGVTKLKVVSEGSSAGNMSIPANGIVISGAGWTVNYLNKMKLGDILEVQSSFMFDDVELTDLVEMSGGCPVILKDGIIQNTDALLDHLKSLQPRTAVGYDSTGSKMVMLVVDGRQTGVSEGVTSKDLAAIMANVGCVDALNFDGGGSSTLYLKDFGVRNVPSEGALRNVVNGLFVTTPVTTDNEIAQIRFEDYAKHLAKGESYSPVIYGYNSKGVLVSKNVAGCELSASSPSVNINGGTVTCNDDATFALKASYNGMSASIAVTVGEKSTDVGVSSLTLEWINTNVASLHTSARQGVGLNGNFYLQNKDTQKIEVWNSTGKIKEIASGAGTNITTDDAGNLIVRVGTFNTNYVASRNEMRIIAADESKTVDLPLAGVAKGRADFWGHASGDMLDATVGGKLLMGTLSSSLIVEIPVKAGRQDETNTNSYAYTNPLGVSGQLSSTNMISVYGDEIAVLSPYDQLSNCNSIQQMRYDEYGSLVHNAYYITPNHNSCAGFCIFAIGNRKYIVYSSGSGKTDGFSVARLATKDVSDVEDSDNAYLEVTKEPMRKSDGSLYSINAFYSNHFSVEKNDDSSVHIYQYYPNGYIAKYLFEPAKSSVVSVDTDKSDLRISVENRCIKVSGTEDDIEVYSINGILVSRGLQEVEVPSGIYVVKVGNEARKVIVK